MSRGPPPISTPATKIPSSSAPLQGTGPVATSQPIGFSPVNQYVGSGNISVTQPAQMAPGQMYRRNEGVPGNTVSSFGVTSSGGTGQPFGASAPDARDRMFNPSASSSVGPMAGSIPPPTVVSSIGGMPFNRGTPSVFVQQRTAVQGDGSSMMSEGAVGGDSGMPPASRVPVSIPMTGPPRVSWNGDVHALCTSTCIP